MSDKPLSVNEIMRLVANYGTLAAVYATTEPEGTHPVTEAWDRIRAELEKLTKAAGDPS
jgi:hypothetical protein